MLSRGDHHLPVIYLNNPERSPIQVPIFLLQANTVFFVTQCLFCGKKRKRKSQSNEALHQCITNDGSKAILHAASKKGDARILGLGEDLIARGQVPQHMSA